MNPRYDTPFWQQAVRQYFRSRRHLAEFAAVILALALRSVETARHMH